jgi:peptide/nickel transport system ATP-binding protein
MSLSVHDLRVYYQTLHGEARALDGVSFSIADGEIMGLAGESGCGKTTLGYSLVRLSPPRRLVGGRAVLDGEELPLGNPDAMRRFGWKGVSIVPQFAMSALNPRCRIGGMIAELLAARKLRYLDLLPELERRLELVRLPAAVLAMYPFELSGGMRQRMVLVLATLLNPSLLVADEVTSALDVSTQRAVAQLLAEFRDRGLVKSMLVITHDLAVLYQIADTIAVMYAGKLVEKAPADVIIHAPRHPYTRLLTSSLPESGARHARRRLTGIPGQPPSLLAPIPGCRFRERCPVVLDQCRDEPPLREVAAGHQVACWQEPC